jgi:hypothetical protein
MRAFKGGVSSNAAQRLLDNFETIGIVLVREGELEGLAPNVQSRKGPEWIVEALRLQSHMGDRAQDHILRVVHAIETQLQDVNLASYTWPFVPTGPTAPPPARGEANLVAGAE